MKTVVLSKQKKKLHLEQCNVILLKVQNEDEKFFCENSTGAGFKIKLR